MKITRKLFLNGVFESATLNVIGLSLLFLSPGLFLAGCIEWGYSDSHNESALFLTALIAAVLGFISGLRETSILATLENLKGNENFIVSFFILQSCFSLLENYI